MSSRLLVDPELIFALDFFSTEQPSDETVGAARERMKASAAFMGAPDPTLGEIEECRIAAPGGHDIALVIHRPHKIQPGPTPAILYIHGGGYFSGSPWITRVPNQRLAAELGCLLVAVDYRLAPETRHPGPLEDCYAALYWLHQQAQRLGVDPARIAVMGESAGGGLAAALCLLARDRGRLPIRHQHLNYPMLDDRTCIADPHPFAGEFVWTRSFNQYAWSALLGHLPGEDGVSFYAAAARAADLTNLPSAFVAVGALDLFIDEDIDYARRLIRAGVPTELHIYPGAYHAFEVSFPAQATRKAYRNSVGALKRALDIS